MLRLLLYFANSDDNNYNILTLVERTTICQQFRFSKY